MKLIKLSLFFPLLFLMACSAAYEKVKKIQSDNPETFHQYLLSNYQQSATFEAEEMHDWNSAKLYSEKALRAISGENIYPEKLTYWKIPEDKLKEIKIGYNNLISIYEEAIIYDPQNLAKAISSLDCWAEQEEEKWQTWDIEKCKNNFLTAMHAIYNNLLTEKKDIEKTEKNTEDKNQVAIVTQNENKDLMQIIYFDFDKFNLSKISFNTLKTFINKNKKDLSNYIVFGHTDTKGSDEYNLRLSIKRAEAIKQILISLGIDENKISVLGRGEKELAIKTPDNTKHPANRRAEVKILN